MEYGKEPWRGKYSKEGDQQNSWVRRTQRGSLPSRSGSRGRGRGQYQQRYDDRPVHRQYQQQVNNPNAVKNTEMEELRQMLTNFGKGLETITKRLDGIQKGTAPEKTTRSANQPYMNRSVNAPRPSTDVLDKSSNPCFPNITKSLYRMAQLQHHEANWRNLPKAINDRLEKFARDIRPPMPDDDFASTIKAVTMEYGEKICAVVRSHIHKKRVEAEIGASKLNPADKDRAKEIASKQLNARLGKRLPTEKRDALLSDACSMVGIHYSTSEDVIDDAFQLVVNGANATNKKRKMTTPTSNRFGPLTMETENDAEPVDNDNQPTTATSVHTPKKAKFLLSRPPAPSKYGGPSTSTASSREFRGVIEEGKRVINHDMPKDEWSLSVDANTKVVVIADSNMRRAPEAPKDWEIHSFSGAKFRHATHLLNNMEIRDGDSTLQHVIIQLGVNHSKDRPEWYEKELAELRLALKGLTVNTTFTGISVSDSLPEKQRTIIQKINDNLEHDEDFGYITPIPSSEVAIIPGDYYGTHHTTDTIAKIINTMVKYNSDLN